MSQQDSKQYSDMSSGRSGNSSIQGPYYTLKPGVEQLGKSKRQELNDYNLCLQRFKFYADGWNQTFNKIQRLDHQGLLLNNNEIPGIIWDLMTPKFSNLLYLNLESNFINNIQALQFIDCESLKTMRISFNQITSLKPLNKTKWDFLDRIQLKQNPIRQIKLNRIHMAPQVKQLVMSSFIKNKSISTKDISILAKLQTKNLKRITCYRQYFFGKKIGQNGKLYKKNTPKCILIYKYFELILN